MYAVPAVNPVTMPVVPLPLRLPDGLPVMVQFPDEGKPLSATLPVATRHVGWVMVPMIGADGRAFTVTVAVAVTAAQLPAAAIVYITV